MGGKIGSKVGGLIGLAPPDTSATDEELSRQADRSERDRTQQVQEDLQRRTEEILRTFGRRNRSNGSLRAPPIMGL